MGSNPWNMRKNLPAPEKLPIFEPSEDTDLYVVNEVKYEEFTHGNMGVFGKSISKQAGMSCANLQAEAVSLDFTLGFVTRWNSSVRIEPQLGTGFN